MCILRVIVQVFIILPVILPPNYSLPIPSLISIPYQLIISAKIGH